MNVRPKNCTTKQFYWTFKQATEMTENITAMPHLHHIAVFHSVLMFQQLSYIWYMEKLNKHGGGKNVIILCTNSFMICMSLSKKAPNKTKQKNQVPNHLHFLLEGNKDLSWRYRTSLWQIWHDTAEVWDLEGCTELLEQILEFLLMFTNK